MTIITDITNIDFEKLESFIYNHPHGNFFQSCKAFQFFQSVDNYEPIFLVAKEGDEIVGSILAVVMKEKGTKGYFSRRCIVWGGPLVKDDHPITVKALLQKLNEIVSAKAIYIEFRNLFDVSKFKNIFSNKGYVFHEHLNFIVRISNENDNWSRLSSSKRRQIRQSLAKGVTIVEASSLEQIRDFYFNLKALYKEKVKKPLPEFSFFEKFFITTSIGKYFLIIYQKKMIGGIMCPVYRDSIYEWFVFGKDGEIKNVYPSALATWAPIEYSAKNGLKYFDFMGAGSPDSDYGVREFKSKFGGEFVEYGRFVRVNNKFLYFIGKLGIKVLGFLK